MAEQQVATAGSLRRDPIVLALVAALRSIERQRTSTEGLMPNSVAANTEASEVDFALPRPAAPISVAADVEPRRRAA